MLALSYSRHFPNELIMAYADDVQTLTYVATNRVDAMKFAFEHCRAGFPELLTSIAACLPESSSTPSYFITGFAGSLLAKNVIERAEDEMDAHQVVVATVEMWIAGVKMMPTRPLDEVILYLAMLDME